MHISIHSRNANDNDSSGKSTFVDANDYEISIVDGESNCGSNMWSCVRISGKARYNIGALIDREFQLVLSPQDIFNLVNVLSRKLILPESNMKKD